MALREKSIDARALMKSAKTRGLALAIIKGGELVRTELLGVANAEQREAVMAETLFEAAASQVSVRRSVGMPTPLSSGLRRWELPNTATAPPPGSPCRLSSARPLSRSLSGR